MAWWVWLLIGIGVGIPLGVLSFYAFIAICLMD
jgi:hypothetical protein